MLKKGIEMAKTVQAKNRKPSVFREVYPIQEPYAYAAIVRDPETQKVRYEVIEPTLLEEEAAMLIEIKTSVSI